jgi:hypothetical protein
VGEAENNFELALVALCIERIPGEA